MINDKNFCRSLAKKGVTITLSSNDQPSIGALSIGKVESALGVCSQNWERFGTELPKEASFESGSEGVGSATTQHSLDALSSVCDLQQLTIKLGKTKIMIFNRSKKVLSNFHFLFQLEIKITTAYTYLVKFSWPRFSLRKSLQL